jgi:hypothetical protein
VLLDVICKVPARHPIRDELERSGSDTQEGDDVFVFQAFPYYSLLVKGL